MTVLSKQVPSSQIPTTLSQAQLNHWCTIDFHATKKLSSKPGIAVKPDLTIEDRKVEYLLLKEEVDSLHQ